ALTADLGVSPEQATWAAKASHGRLARARALLDDEPTRLHRASTLDLVERLAGGLASDALAAATVIVDLADEVVAARRAQQAKELVELEEAFGTGRGTGTIRKRLETRHPRAPRRLRVGGISDARA